MYWHRVILDVEANVDVGDVDLARGAAALAALDYVAHPVGLLLSAAMSATAIIANAASTSINVNPVSLSRRILAICFVLSRQHTHISDRRAGNGIILRAKRQFYGISHGRTLRTEFQPHGIARAHGLD